MSEGSVQHSSSAAADDPVAVRMVSDDSRPSMQSVDSQRRSGSSSSSSSYVDLVSLAAVFVAATLMTVVSLTAFVAVYVYVEAVRRSLCSLSRRCNKRSDENLKKTLKNV